MRFREGAATLGLFQRSPRGPRAFEGSQQARRLDGADPLATLYDRFYHPPDAVYLDGNSLGLLSRDAERSILRALAEWKRLGVGGWLDGDRPWAHYGERLGARLAGLVGAQPSEVVVTGSTTANLHHLVCGLYAPTETRHVIVVDALNFPSDLHAIKGQVALRGRDPGTSLRIVRSRDGNLIEEEDVEAALGPDVALLLLPAVLYRSSQWLDIPRLTRAAHEAGAVVAWDLSHAIGAVPLALTDAGADMAFWSTYKYLHAGPGSIAGLYIHGRHHGVKPALPGWWGQTLERKFEMLPDHVPAAGAAGWQIGTIPVLSAAPLWGALDIVEEAGMDRIREKSVGLTSFLIDAVDALLPEEETGVRVATPRDPERRGGHVALSCPRGAGELLRGLEARGIVVDFRPPDILRLAPSPLSTRYQDVWRAVSVLAKLVRG